MADNRSSKRPRASFSSDQDNSGGEAVARGPLCFDQLLALPEELRAQILDEVYHLPSPPSPAASTTSCSAPFDIATMLNLACTSRWFYIQITLKLWRDIRITRPSALAALQRSLASRPQLGRLIRSLHVGPDDELPEWCSRPPIRLQPSSGTRCVSTSFRSEEAKLLPHWCEPGSEWSLEPRGDDLRALAISRALAAVGESLGVALASAANPWPSKRTVLAAYEAQAALDLYLLELRRIDEETKSIAHNSPSSHRCEDDPAHYYPRVVLIGTEQQPRLGAYGSAEKPYVLTRLQLLNHLTRAGAPTDRFDHPLLLERSGFDTQLASPLSKLERRLPSRSAEDPEDFADVYTPKGLQDFDDPTKALLDPQRPALTNLPTSGSLLGILRSIFVLAPRIENLSLSGLFERAVCGRTSCRGLLDSLRCVSIGPPPAVRSWYGPLPFDNLRDVEKLRISGFVLHGEEVEKLASMWRLRELRWTMGDELSDKERLCLGLLIDGLIGRKGAAADAAIRELGWSELIKLRLPFLYSAAREDPPEEENESLQRDSGPLVEVKLRSSVLKAMLDRASNEQEREDWALGRARRTQERRLLLSELPPPGSAAADMSMGQALYEDGQQWWERNRKITEPRPARYRPSGLY